MKSAAIKRALFVKRKLSSEDCWPLNEYLESQKELSADILRENGIDPDSLFDIVTVDKKLTTQERKVYQNHGKEPPQSREWECQKWTTLDRDSLNWKTDQALEVFLLYTGAHRNLQSPERHDAFCDGIRLATAAEHMNANIAWWPTVKKKIHQTVVAIANNAKRRDKTKQTAEAEWQPRCDEFFRNNPNQSWHEIAIKVGHSFGQSYSTIKRHCKDPTIV